MELPDNLPSSAAMQGIMDDLNRALENVPDTQTRLMSLSGVAWSDDRMVKVEVGPRGQLVDLEIDPRVFRKPDSQALRASILAAAAAAVRDITAQANEIVLGELPPELAELRAQLDPGGGDTMAQMFRTDAEILAERKRTDA